MNEPKYDTHNYDIKNLEMMIFKDLNSYLFIII